MARRTPRPAGWFSGIPRCTRRPLPASSCPGAKRVAGAVLEQQHRPGHAGDTDGLAQRRQRPAETVHPIEGEHADRQVPKLHRRSLAPGRGGRNGRRSGRCLLDPRQRLGASQCRRGRVDRRARGAAGQRRAQRLRDLSQLSPGRLGERAQRGVDAGEEKSVAASAAPSSRSSSFASGVSSAFAFGSIGSGSGCARNVAMSASSTSVFARSFSCGMSARMRRAASARARARADGQVATAFRGKAGHRRRRGYRRR